MVSSAALKAFIFNSSHNQSLSDFGNVIMKLENFNWFKLYAVTLSNCHTWESKLRTLAISQSGRQLLHAPRPLFSHSKHFLFKVYLVRYNVIS